MTADEVRALIGRLGLTQVELADRLDLHRNTISCWCREGTSKTRDDYALLHMEHIMSTHIERTATGTYVYTTIAQLAQLEDAWIFSDELGGAAGERIRFRRALNLAEAAEALLEEQETFAHEWVLERKKDGTWHVGVERYTDDDLTELVDLDEAAETVPGVWLVTTRADRWCGYYEGDTAEDALAACAEDARADVDALQAEPATY